MDWAVRAAKKKTKVLAGSSRSIVESFNLFNETALEAHNEIDLLIKKAQDWQENDFENEDEKKEVEMEVKNDESQSVEIATFSSTKNTTTNIMSPEKTIAFDLNGSKIDNSILTQSTEHVPKTEKKRPMDSEKHVTPIKRKKQVPSVTPKSLVEDRSLQDLTSNSVGHNTTGHYSVEFSKSPAHDLKNARKSLPWSPFRNGKLSKESTTIASFENNSRSTYSSSTDSTTVVTQRNLQTKVEQLENNEVVKNTNFTASANSLESNVKIKSTINNDVANRHSLSKRRSNMFVPLPDKDPLIIAPRTSNLLDSAPLASNKSLLESMSNTIKSNPRHSIQLDSKNELEKLESNDPHTLNLEFSAKEASLPYVKRASIATAKIGKSTKHTKSTVSASRNVFDRLSALPTKSFKKKISRKVSRLTSSSIDNNGSPIRRSSPSSGHNDPLTSTMQEALKSIFSTSNSPTTKISSKNELATLKSKNSLIPKIKPHELKPKSKHSSNNYDPSVSPSVVIDKKNSPSRHSSRLHILSPSKSAASPATEKTLSRVKSPFKSSKKSPLRAIVERKQPAQKAFSVFDKELPDTKPISNNCTTRRSIDGSRLSRISSQFYYNHHATKYHHVANSAMEHKTSSNLNDHNSSTSQTNDKLNTNHESSTQLKKLSRKQLTGAKLQMLHKPLDNVENFDSGVPVKNSVLHDLNTVDHRLKAHESITPMKNTAKLASSPVGDQSLPEIMSDSDEDENSIMTAWAEKGNLEKQLIKQQSWNAKEIFGPIPPLHIDEVFQNSRLNKLKGKPSLLNKVK